MAGYDKKYVSHRNRMAQRSADESRSVRDVGRHQHTEAVRRKRSYQDDLRKFVVEVFPAAVPLKMSPDHEAFLTKAQDKLLHGGQEAIALPRGSGKTTIIIIAILWALLYGHRRYVAVICGTAVDARRIIVSIKRHLEKNNTLAELFPEVCHYVRALEGQTQRAGGQLADGVLTNIIWRTELIAFPAFERNEKYLELCPQAIVEARGLTGGIRGLQFTDNEGEVLRPDMVLFDDPQTRESAKSAEQTKTRIELIDGDVLGCAGPTVEIAALMACTVITDDDLSEHYLKEWPSTRAGMIEKWSDNEALWEEYRNLYRQTKTLDKQQQAKKLNAFYRKHRKEMDSGAVERWPERVIGSALSSLQSAWNLRCRIGDAAYFAEYQNQPLRQNTNLYSLTIDTVLSRVNGIAHRMLPPDAPLLVCAADVNYYAISYAVAAFRSDFAASIVDYGWFPESGEVYNAKTSEVSEEQAIYGALAKFTMQIKAVHPGLQLLGIDGNRFTAPVVKFVKNNAHLLPVRLVILRGVAAKQYKEPARGTPGLIGAPRTRCSLRMSSQGVPEARFDSYFWHYTMQRMWLLTPGSPGSLSLFGDRTINHRTFAEQVCADKLVDYYERLGELVYEWKTIGHNEMSDCVTMAGVVANLAGLEPGGVAASPNPPAVRRRRGVKRPVINRM